MTVLDDSKRGFNIPFVGLAPRCPSPEIEASELLFSKSRPSLLTSPESPLRKERKRVRFQNTVLVCDTISFRDMDEQEIADAWYSKSEHRKIRSDCVVLLGHMLQGTFLDDDDFDCIRGLECRTPFASKQRLRIRQAAWSAVFEEQQDQRQLGNWRSAQVSIASAYMDQSHQCCKEALQRAWQDETEVMEMD